MLLAKIMTTNPGKTEKFPVFSLFNRELGRENGSL
jgi:hypothetical protein